MFGIGGGELIFIVLIVLMLFGTDKLPEMVRTMGKTMAQLKNATNDIKSELQKGLDDSGLNKQSLTEITDQVTAEVNKIADDTLGETVTELEQTKEVVEEAVGPIKREV